MLVAVLSGKGGTGKTLLSVNLAAASENSTYIDCDVEEPNGHIFLKPEPMEEKDVAVQIPQVDMNLCNGCRKCVDFCNFNALAYVIDSLLVFEEICHSCGGCVLVCPEKALKEKERVIGKTLHGISSHNISGRMIVHTGLLNTGEASGIPIIKDLLDFDNDAKSNPVFIDCPPGSACIVMESIKNADYCILVAEPTLFGVHNLEMVYQLVSLFDKPFGVVLNKCLDGEYNPSQDFCEKKGIKILGSIPYDTQLGLLNSNGEIAVEVSERYRDIFTNLLNTIREECRQFETAFNT
ncbi:MAG: 4Fe-4S binding protein [Anaerovoracaceae bacterium]